MFFSTFFKTKRIDLIAGAHHNFMKTTRIMNVLKEDQTHGWRPTYPLMLVRLKVK